jgi:hypothetical protein
MPSPEKGPQESANKFPSGDMSAFGALCGGRVDAVSSLLCNGLGREDVEFLVTVLGEREPPAHAMNELWEWLTTAPHDSGYARSPTDEDLGALAGETLSVECGRRGNSQELEYFSTFRVEKGGWSGMSLTFSHYEGTAERERVLFSASVGTAEKEGHFAPVERVNRLVRSCGLMNFKAGENGADIIARSGTLTEAGEFCIFLGKDPR